MWLEEFYNITAHTAKTRLEELYNIAAQSAKSLAETGMIFINLTAHSVKIIRPGELYNIPAQSAKYGSRRVSVPHSIISMNEFTPANVPVININTNSLVKSQGNCVQRAHARRCQTPLNKPIK